MPGIPSPIQIIVKVALRILKGMATRLITPGKGLSKLLNSVPKMGKNLKKAGKKLFKEASQEGKRFKKRIKKKFKSKLSDLKNSFKLKNILVRAKDFAVREIKKIAYSDGIDLDKFLRPFKPPKSKAPQKIEERRGISI